MSSQPSQNSKSARKLSLGQAALEWISMYPWGLSKDEMNLDRIWQWFKDFCKPQSNVVRAQFDLLTSFHQGHKSVDEWYNTVQVQVNLAKYPPETVKILH